MIIIIIVVNVYVEFNFVFSLAVKQAIITSLLHADNFTHIESSPLIIIVSVK